jgi:hypothetical protein
MLSVFMAGPDLVSWDLTALGPNGPYRLTIRHASGSIVEYFHDVATALLREGELEDLLIAARASAASEPEPDRPAAGESAHQ